MANKPAPRNWNDVQLMIATGSMAFTLVFWNLFAGPDRETAIRRAQEQAALPPSQPVQETAPAVEPQPSTLQTTGPILLGGSAPQTQVIVKVNRGGGGGDGGGGGGGGGGGSTSTSSS
ncbi:MAG: hypothetical protein HY865_08915 [Chloroflexi bacterium]|nr:hypothetical protein [Chloroflexota bacterium]